MSLIKMSDRKLQFRPRKSRSDHLVMCNEEDLTEDITDKGAHIALMPNSGSLNKNMENSPLNRKGSPRKCSNAVNNFTQKSFEDGQQSTNCYQSDNCIQKINLKELNLSTANINKERKFIKENSFPIPKRLASITKKERANSNTLENSKMNNQLLKLISCEECEEIKKESVFERRLSIKEEISQLLRFLAETNKVNQKECCKLDINKRCEDESANIITMKDILSQSQANEEAY